MSRYKLKPCRNSKGAGKFVRKLRTSSINLSEEWLTNELRYLGLDSRKNNIAKVNVNVNFLLSSPEFWVHCYESIKSNPGILSTGGNFDSSVNLSVDGIDLDYFDLLAKKIKSGRFRFGPTRKTIITKPGGGSRPSALLTVATKLFKKELLLSLNLSKEKTKITYLKRDEAEFLGFELRQSAFRIPSPKKDVNPKGIRDR